MSPVWWLSPTRDRAYRAATVVTEEGIKFFV
jgi:hypothetical protein